LNDLSAFSFSFRISYFAQAAVSNIPRCGSSGNYEDLLLLQRKVAAGKLQNLVYHLV